MVNLLDYAMIGDLLLNLSEISSINFTRDKDEKIQGAEIEMQNRHSYFFSDEVARNIADYFFERCQQSNRIEIKES